MKSRIEKEMSEPDFWDHQERAQKRVDTLSTVKNLCEEFDQAMDLCEDLSVLLELGMEEDDPDTLEEVADQLPELEDRVEKLEILSFLSGKNDRKNAFFSIQTGAGGVDACDWTQMLWRMYSRWFKSRDDLSFEVIAKREGEEAGLKHITARVEGEFAFGVLKGEMGVHRLERISPFDSSGRRHTSFAAVDVVPEFEEIDIDINENDLRIDFYRASGAGGQHVNVTDSAVRITYEPEDITVQCQNERSQHANRKTAMSMLRSRLKALKEKEREEELQNMYGNKGEISWGNQIRSYTLDPYQKIKDHRTELERHDVENVMEGDLDEFVDAYLRRDT